MKKLSTLSAVILAVAQANAAAVLEQVIVRQQWPWSTDIKVEYKISGIEEGSPVDIKVEAYNGGVPLESPTLKSAITGKLLDGAAYIAKYTGLPEVVDRKREIARVLADTQDADVSRLWVN